MENPDHYHRAGAGTCYRVPLLQIDQVLKGQDDVEAPPLVHGPDGSHEQIGRAYVAVEDRSWRRDTDERIVGIRCEGVVEDRRLLVFKEFLQRLVKQEQLCGRHSHANRTLVRHPSRPPQRSSMNLPKPPSNVPCPPMCRSSPNKVDSYLTLIGTLAPTTSGRSGS
jgi:hypothetical protein